MIWPAIAPGGVRSGGGPASLQGTRGPGGIGGRSFRYRAPGPPGDHASDEGSFCRSPPEGGFSGSAAGARVLIFNCRLRGGSIQLPAAGVIRAERGWYGRRPLPGICGKGAGLPSGHARARGAIEGVSSAGHRPPGGMGISRVCCRRAGFDLSLSFARWIYTAAGGGVVKPRAPPGGGLRIARVPPAAIA